MKPRDDAENRRKDILARAIAIGIKNQHQFRPEPLFKLTGKSHYVSEAVEEIEETNHSQSEREDE